MIASPVTERLLLSKRARKRKAPVPCAKDFILEDRPEVVVLPLPGFETLDDKECLPELHDVVFPCPSWLKSTGLDGCASVRLEVSNGDSIP